MHNCEFVIEVLVEMVWSIGIVCFEKLLCYETGSVLLCVCLQVSAGSFCVFLPPCDCWVCIL